MGNEMGNTNVSSMKVEEAKAEVHFQDQFSDNSLTDPVKKQIIAEDHIPPAEAEENEEKQVISTSQDHPNAGDQLNNQLSHARDESLTTTNESCDAAIRHRLVEEKEARQVAGSVSTESEGSKAEHESITVLPEAIVIDETSSRVTNIDGAEMPLNSSMLLEDKGVIYLNLKEAKCEKNVDHEKETIDTGDHCEREIIASPYVDIVAKDVKSLNQIGAQISTNDQVDENIFQEKQERDKSCEHEENIRSHSTKSESDEPEIVACEPLVQLGDGTARLSNSAELPELSNHHNDDIQIEKHIQNMVLKVVEDRHGDELRERKDQSSVAHESRIDETGERTSVNEDLRQTDVPAVDTTVHEGKIVSLMLNEITEPNYQQYEDANATYFTPRSQSQPLDFLSDTEVDKPKEEFRGMSSSTVEIVPPCPIICEMKKENGATEGLEGNFSKVDPFSEKETDQSEVADQMMEDKTETFPRDQDDKPEQEPKEVVPPIPRSFANKIEKENVDSSTDKQKDNSAKVNQMKGGDMKGFPVKEDDQLASESTVQHDRLKFLMIENGEPEMEVSSPTDGAVNNGSETVKDDILIEQAETTEAIKLKDDAMEIKSESDLFGQPDHFTDEKILVQSDTIIHDHLKESQTQTSCPPLDQASLTNTISDITTGVASVEPISEHKTSKSMEEDVKLQQISDYQSQKNMLQPTAQIDDCNEILVGGCHSSSLEMDDSGEHLEEVKLKSEYFDQTKVSEADKRCLQSDPTIEEGNSNGNSDGTACILDKGPNAETASIDIDESQKSDSAKVSASEGSESGKLRSPLKIFLKTCTVSRSIKEESRETSNAGDSLGCHLKKMSLPSSGGREKQKTRSIFSSCMCCTAVIR